jgi:hypothetical protein
MANNGDGTGDMLAGGGHSRPEDHGGRETARGGILGSFREGDGVVTGHSAVSARRCYGATSLDTVDPTRPTGSRQIQQIPLYFVSCRL